MNTSCHRYGKQDKNWLCHIARERAREPASARKQAKARASQQTPEQERAKQKEGTRERERARERHSQRERARASLYPTSDRETQIPRYLAVQIQIEILVKFEFVPKYLSFSTCWISGR